MFPHVILTKYGSERTRSLHRNNYNHNIGVQEKHREVKHHLELERQTAVTQDEEKTDAALESTKQV